MKILLSLLIGLSLIANPAFAAPKENAHGQGYSHGHGQGPLEKAEKKITDETVDAVVDELVGSESAPKGTGVPPGLAKKGKTPPGLAKQGKTPPGWQKAEFGEPEKKEGLIRRWVRNIFGGGKKEEETKKED